MTLSPLASRLIAWGLFANLCWAFFAFLAVPLFRQIRADRESIATSRDLLSRYQRLEADLPAIRARLEEIKTKTENDRYFFASASPALAAAEMQNQVRGFVSKSGASLRSSKSLEPVDEKGFHRVGIDLDVTASPPQLLALLHAVEQAEPIVLVDRLFAQVPENGAATAASDGQPAITISLRLVAYAKHAQVGAKS